MYPANINKMCRLCLYQGSETDYISIYNNSAANLLNRIKECVSIEVNMKEFNDRFPSVICSSCIQQLNQWSNFREICHQSHNILLESINNSANKNPNKLYLNIIKNEHNDTENKNIDDFLSEDVCNNLKIDIDTDTPESDQFASDTLEEINEKPKRKVILKCIAKTKRKTKFKKKENPIKIESHEDYDLSCIEDSTETVDNYLHQIDEENNELIKAIPTFNYNCDICESTFTSIFEYLDHQESHNGDPVFKCHKCTQIFSSRKDLVEHDARHQIPCPNCGKLILPSCMKVHLVLHTDKYKCSQCNWRFSNSTMLRQHIESVHIRLKTHICETCGKSFTSTTSLQTHIKIHSDARPYSCKICDYAGRTASALYTHMARHENGLHVCEICAKSFKSFRSLRDHTRRVHSEKKNHECGICHKKFVDKYMLTVHTRTHTGARPYQCTHCDRAFVRSDGLKEHLATHGQRSSYSCQQCDKKFIYRRSLNRHTCISVGN